MGRCATAQAAYLPPEAAVRALGEAEIQRWRELVLVNEPRRAWMNAHDSMTPAWLGVLYDRAVLGVVAVGGPDGGTVEILVAEYWAREQASATTNSAGEI